MPGTGRSSGCRGHTGLASLCRWSLLPRSRQTISQGKSQKVSGRYPGVSTAALRSAKQEGRGAVVPATIPRASSMPRSTRLVSPRRQVMQTAAVSEKSWMSDDGKESPSAEAIDEMFAEAAEEFLRISALEFNSQLKDPLPGARLDEDSVGGQVPADWHAEFQDDEGEEWEVLEDVGYSDDMDVETPSEAYNWDTVFSGADDARLGPGPSTGLLEDFLPLPLESKALGWCGLCGIRSGWIDCGACGGLGAYPTKPGLAGKSGIVGLARCKTCYGWCKVPCILCGVKGRKEWAQWQEGVRRRPKKTWPLGPGPG